MTFNPGEISRVVVVPPISQFKIPLPFWQRLEPRARTDNFARSIQAQIHDPLWMLTRQWQLGEFQGDDAGSPVNATIQTKVTELTNIRLGASGGTAVKSITSDVPLEVIVEQEFPKVDWRTAVQIGQQFEREIRNQEGMTNAQRITVLSIFKRRYPLTMPEGNALLELDDATHEFLEVMAGRAIDGNSMLLDGLIVENPVLPANLGVSNELTVPVKEVLRGLWEWRRLLHGEGFEESSSAWQHDRLEYEFQVSAKDPHEEQREIVLVTPEYDGRKLDWPDFSLHHDPNVRLTVGANSEEGEPSVLDTGSIDNNDSDEDNNQTTEFVPTPVFFRGMPNHRWWEFEDRQIDFGDLTVNTTDLGKLILMEFALIHGNDWFLFPMPLPIGSLCSIAKLDVIDVFGQTTGIQRAGTREEDNWQRWDMFRLAPTDMATRVVESSEGSGRRNDFLFLPPTLPRIDQSPTLEEVLFLRDEMANMVWAVERTILNGLGEPHSGYEEYLSRLRRLKEQKDRETAERINTVAEELEELANEAAAAATAASEATTPEAIASHTETAEEALRELEERAARAAEEVGESAEEGEASRTSTAPIAYRLAKTVPENWIPYVLFHTGNSQRAVELRQANMMRNMDDLQPVLIRAMSYLLTEAGTGHQLHEEAVSRAARRVRLTTQRARWADGSTHIWIGRGVGPGGGEGSSGLRFDLIQDQPQQTD